MLRFCARNAATAWLVENLPTLSCHLFTSTRGWRFARRRAPQGLAVASLVPLLTAVLDHSTLESARQANIARAIVVGGLRLFCRASGCRSARRWCCPAARRGSALR